MLNDTTIDFSPIQDTDDDSIYDDNTELDPDYEFLDDKSNFSIPEELQKPIKVSMRFNISPEVTALIINSTLQAVNRQDKMVSSSGIRNLKSKIANDAIVSHDAENQELVCLKFDGKKCPTRQAKSKMKNEEHITVIKEPKAGYVYRTFLIFFVCVIDTTI